MQKGPKPAELTVSREERTALEELVRRHQTPQHLAKRGRMILGAADGKRNAEMARELGTSVDTVRKWRMRWLSAQAVSLEDCAVTHRLSDEQRPGRPAQITAEQTCQLIALACEQPKERPISQWTGREIADEAVARGIMEHISPRHAARLLKKGLSSRI